MLRLGTVACHVGLASDSCSSCECPSAGTADPLAGVAGRCRTARGGTSHRSWSQADLSYLAPFRPGWISWRHRIRRVEGHHTKPCAPQTTHSQSSYWPAGRAALLAGLTGGMSVLDTVEQLPASIGSSPASNCPASTGTRQGRSQRSRRCAMASRPPLTEPGRQSPASPLGGMSNARQVCAAWATLRSA
jgi:hypothetical protein